MKGLRLPVMSNEEREKAWNNLKEGDTLVLINYYIWGDSYSIFYRTVAKRTPKGSIIFDNGILLKQFESKYHIITTELNTWIRNIELEKEVMSLLSEADRDKRSFCNELTYEDTLKLKEIFKRTIKKE